MQYKYLIAILCAAVLSAICASSPAYARCEATPSAAQSHYAIVSYLHKIKTAGDGIDEISDGQLEEISTYHGLVWWRVFGAAMAAEEILTDLRNENYVDALARVSKYTVSGFLKTNSTIKAMGGVNDVAGLAVIPIELSIRKWAKLVNEKGMAFQEAAYRAARSYPYEMSHSDIMNRRAPDATVLFEDSSGYLFAVGDLKSNSYYPFRPDAGIDRDTFYEMMRLAYEADEIKERNRSQAKAALSLFQKQMADGGFAGIDSGISGTWYGYTTAGGLKLDYSWEVLQAGDCVSGTISLKMPNRSNWSRYTFEGEMNGSTLDWRGTRWITSGNGSFCMASGQLELTTHGTEAVLAGSWGPHRVWGGCPKGNSGSVRLELQ